LELERVFGKTPATENDKPDFVLYNEEIRNVYSTPNIRVIHWRKVRWAGHAARIGRRNSYRRLVVKSEWQRLIGRPRCGWEGNTEIALKEMG